MINEFYNEIWHTMQSGGPPWLSGSFFKSSSMSAYLVNKNDREIELIRKLNLIRLGREIENGVKRIIPLSKFLSSSRSVSNSSIGFSTFPAKRKRKRKSF